MLPCDHRGNRVRHVACDLCDKRKGQRFSVYACDLHGECTANKVHSKIKGCRACLDRITGRSSS